MANIIECVQGADRVRTIRLVDTDGDAITTFTTGATVTAGVWPGDDRAEAFDVAVDKSAIATGELTLSFAAADTATLDPGDYPVLVTIVAGGKSRKRRVATLRITSAPGSAAAPSVYCSHKQLRDELSWIDELQTDEDQAGFAEARAEAREWTEERIQACRPRRQRSYGYEPAYSTDGPDPWLKEQLDAGALVVTRSIRLANVYYALARILSGQIGTRDKTSLQALGERYRARAEVELRNSTASIDTNADGVGDVHIRLHSIRVRRG